MIRATTLLTPALPAAPQRPVQAPAAKPVAATTAPSTTFRELSIAHQAQVALVKQAHEDPTAFQQATSGLMAWLAEQERHPENAAYGEFFRSWYASAADQFLAARPLTTPAARRERYAQLDQAFQASRTEANRALAGASAKELPNPNFAPGAASADVRAALAPALGHLARSTDPVARELAARIASGAIPFKVTTGGHLGVQYFAMMAVSGITLSNGKVGPDFFALSPPYQAAVLRHEYTHVQQKTHVSGYAKLMASNLTQRFLTILGRVPGLDGEAFETRGRRYNFTEQEAYRNEKAFLQAQGWGDRGMLLSDAGMLEGIDTWLEAAR
ncbi:MAG: hypothetical protein JWM80_3494 [Cyanobacteria bacterium RYN_339]|nr:hypothetical protein [Cyanobacteria bacterium RYN_339]